jgi:hypothetical protein
MSRNPTSIDWIERCSGLGASSTIASLNNAVAAHDSNAKGWDVAHTAQTFFDNYKSDTIMSKIFPASFTIEPIHDTWAQDEILAVSEAISDPVRLGVIGLGMAGVVMIHAAFKHPVVTLVPAADPQPSPREEFARDIGRDAYENALQEASAPTLKLCTSRRRTNFIARTR